MADAAKAPSSGSGSWCGFYIYFLTIIQKQTPTKYSDAVLLLFLVVVVVVSSISYLAHSRGYEGALLRIRVVMHGQCGGHARAERAISFLLRLTQPLALTNLKKSEFTSDIYVHSYMFTQTETQARAHTQAQADRDRHTHKHRHTN